MSSRITSRSKQNKSIKIGAIPFTIRHQRALKDPDDPEEVIDGLLIREDYAIAINSDLEQMQQVQTLFHEAIHAALYITGQRQDMTAAREESLVLALEHMIWPLIPEFMRRAKEAYAADKG